MNREEVDHGCSQEESEEIEIQEEGQEGCAEEESSAALQSEAQVCGKEESAAEKEICTEEKGSREETGAACAASSCASTGGIAEPHHLSPVQPAGGRRQSG